ncbi:MAG: glycosyltransferase [Clostridiales bacterium]|nr:glycosyltransferase [Clostridiales bacterium]
MASILMINVPYSGHTNPTLPLANELIKRGHKVLYINAEEFREKIEATGATFIPYINYPSNPSEQQQKTKCFRAAFETALNINVRIDLLIYEMFFYPGIRIAEKLGIPCVRQFSQPAWSKESVSDATMFLRISCMLIDMQVMRNKNVDFMQLKNKSLIQAVLYDKPDLNIVYVPQVFQPYRNSFGENYLFINPRLQPSLSKQVIPFSKMRRPIIYISLGSIISNKGFCKECIRAFGGKELTVILNTGKVNPQALGKIPDNIYAYSFVPQIEVLRKADLFLTHCGMNSINEAMTLGVPMVAMPFINDQISNANRVVELGIGKKVRSFPSSGRELYATCQSVIRDEKIKERCYELQMELKKDENFEKIIIEIEKLLI